MLKITMILGNFDRLPGASDLSHTVECARLADEAGLYAVATGEHVSLSGEAEDYPYAGGLANFEGGRRPFLEPAVLAGALSAVTSRVRLSQAIMLAPLRPAVLLAKQLATIDVLSRGRCDPVFGTGWSRAEYASLGVDFAARRRILRDNIAACRALWEKQPASFQSQTVSFENLYSMPMPIQRRIPILLAVKANEKNAALVAELCDGWETGPDVCRSPETLRTGVDVYRQAFTAAGRDPNDLIVRAHLRLIWDEARGFDLDATFAQAPPMLDAGANEFVLGAPGGFDNGLNSLSDIGRLMEGIGRMASRY